MKASELVDRLKHLMVEHGDLEVKLEVEHHGYADMNDIESVDLCGAGWA
jgi:hypothetical protein